MKKISVKTSHPYEVLIERGALAKSGEYIAKVTSSRKAAVITDDIVYRDGKPYVFTAKSESSESSVNMVSVKEGLSVDNKTEIQEGLKEGDVIIVKGQSLLSDGSKVKILSISGKAVESKTENKD